MLKVSNLQKTFRGGDGQPVHAVDDVSFEVSDGVFASIIGKSGSGKSISSLAMIGLLPDQLKVTGKVNLHQADFVLLSPFMEDCDDYTIFDKTLEEIAGLELPVYCPNPDVHAPHQGTLRKTAGFFAERLERLGGTVIRIGKPYAPIFDYALTQYGHPVDKKKILMIGDGMATDIKGGIDFGIDTLFVEDGISRLLTEEHNFCSKFRIDHLQ